MKVFLKKRKYVDRRGFPPLPAPTPIRYSCTEFNWGIGRKFQRFGDHLLSQPGPPKWQGGAPGALLNFRIT
jgi:hypothetical protein